MKINLPGVFWIVLILALIPAISAAREMLPSVAVARPF